MKLVGSVNDGARKTNSFAAASRFDPDRRPQYKMTTGEAARNKFPMNQRDLEKDRLRQKQKLYNTASLSSLRNSYRDEWVHSYRQVRRLETNKWKNLLAASGRSVLLPPLPARKLPERMVSSNDRTNGFGTSAETITNLKKVPKYLPKLETRETQLKEVMKEIYVGSKKIRNMEKTDREDKLPPLKRRAVVKPPVRAAISTSATLRGLVRLNLEQHFIFRFRLSNYDVKDINTATLNEPV